jgi:DNA-directed RNA polymerase subunit RPC12/RpoP
VLTLSGPLTSERDALPPCPRCERTFDVHPNLITDRVAYYRCHGCGHLWPVKLATTDEDAAPAEEARRGENGPVWTGPLGRIASRMFS